MIDVESLSGKNVLIKTYLTEGGLWYLAKSLGDILSKKNKVTYISKAKYSKSPIGYQRVYSKPFDPLLLNGVESITLSQTLPISTQIVKICKEKGVDLILSFETFANYNKWPIEVRANTKVKIIDIPMPEWTDRKTLLNSGKFFDQVWCLTDTSYNLFKHTNKAERVSWDYVDRNTFRPLGTKSSTGVVSFYHPARVNPGFDQKNTKLVLSAFKAASEELGDDVRLLVSGSLNNDEDKIAKSCKNIIVSSGVHDRGEIAEFYNSAHCVIMPSMREGLGMSLYEAKAMGCEIITTNVDPMNKHSSYLCQPISYNKSGSNDPITPIYA